ncbi:hypothetical protein AXG93_93s1470 [Marchantia polymorpha subsp. ruderalis]|uniref:Uncharacterized protein n=1 Tax=Marchantia polymorpha subsp. ruderalis TaxID=1480154 RepID=A0A176WSA9_MARPO|nr:hypothetical protein AXG93_93s1470 [Marchantia polymorpha subsp. ruderalis]
METTFEKLFRNLGDNIENLKSQVPAEFGDRFGNFRKNMVALAKQSWKADRGPPREGLPLLLQSPWHPSITVGETNEVDKVVEALRDFSAELLSLLKGTDASKVRLMILERGPWQLVLGVSRFVRGSIWEKSATSGLVSAVTTRINERVLVLTAVQRRLASLVGQTDASSYEDVKATSSISLRFDEISDNLRSKSEWKGKDMDDAVDLLFTNLDLLRTLIDCLMFHHRKPHKITRYWLRYTGGAVGLAFASGWLIRHSRLGGSDDIDRWLREGREAVMTFIREHVEQPLLSIRDDLFETFRKRHHEPDSLGEAQLTAESLNRMLLEFVKHTSDKLPEDLTEQQMMEVMMTRYEEELVHPLRNLLAGQLARALLIQVQKLKLDTERAMLELNQILRANEINFAILAAFPAVIVTCFLGYFGKVLLIETDEVGRGRAAQAKRRMLMAEVEKAIMCFQMMLDEARQEEAMWRFGMVIYGLDRLYKAVKKVAVESGEWPSYEFAAVIFATPSDEKIHNAGGFEIISLLESMSTRTFHGTPAVLYPHLTSKVGVGNADQV